ncbi:PKD domain-containing protein [Dyadobacter flavalbus]|uniref:PKD domain-containing protein n=1 Tax=Dyadobacter flavalbus TaxID=2579942 RepID=A0A5M8QZF7_9BACT|nr:PKD domain-containing protein [Dyadobacter flavalbus]KAA6439412.1 PKD domain-containing protein [Dyadobacter flavalbus]
MANRPNVYLIHASDAVQHVDYIKEILNRLKTGNRISGFIPVEGAAAWTLPEKNLLAGDAVIVLLTNQIIPFKDEGEKYLKSLHNKELKVIEIIIDSIPYDSGFYFFPDDAQPIREKGKMDEAWNKIEKGLEQMFPPVNAKEKQFVFGKYLKYAAAAVGLLLLIWLVPKLFNQDEVNFTFRVQDALMKQKKDTTSCYQPCLASFYAESDHPENLVWDFGDTLQKAVITGQYPEYLFTQAGTYTIKLATGKEDNAASMEKKLVVKPVPQADFEVVNNGCVAPCQLTFINRSSYADQYSWDLGNGTATTEKDAKNIHYAASGNFTVRLTASNKDGIRLDTSKSVTIAVDESPFAQFSVSYTGDVQHPYRMTFKNNSKYSNEYTWSFGDGSTILKKNSQEPIPHDFPELKTYRVTLVASNNQSAMDSFFYDVYPKSYILPIRDLMKTVIRTNPAYSEEIKKYSIKDAARFPR